MGEHVDVVLNDFGRRVQVLAATVICEHGQLHVKDAIDGTTDATLRRIAAQAMSLTSDAPLATFVRLMSGSDLFAIDPHVTGCPFSNGAREIPMDEGDFDDALAKALKV